MSHSARNKSKSKATLPELTQYGQQQKKIVLTGEQLEKSRERLYQHSLKAILERRSKYDEEVRYQMFHNDPCHGNKNQKKLIAELSDKEKQAIVKLYSQPMESKAKSHETLE